MPIYSHSRLSAFKNCPRQYWFEYVARTEVERPDTVEAFLGIRVHDALERLYRLLLGGHLMSQTELLDWYEDDWDRQWYDAIRVVRDDLGPDDYRKAGHDCLSAYYHRYAPFDQSQTLRLECPVLIDLDEAGRYRMKGYIDRVAQRTDGTYEVHDYKTSSYLPTQAEADADRQLAIYQIGVMGMWGDVQDVDLVWHYLRFDKEIRSRRTSPQLEALKAECVALIEDIEDRGQDEANFPTRLSALCDWCDFREICPATKHHVAVEALMPEEFKADDGVRLVDRWAELRERRLALQKQAEALKDEEQQVQEQLVALARREGLESVAGSSHHAAIADVVSIEYPKSGDERRKEFEKTLRRLGLWDQASGIDATKLEALWLARGGLSFEAREALAPFVTQRVEPRARLKKGGRDDE